MTRVHALKKKKKKVVQQQYHQNFQNQTAEAHIRLDFGFHLRLECGKSIPAFSGRLGSNQEQVFAVCCISQCCHLVED